MKKLKEFTREELLGLHLSVVREIGSYIGVKAATSLGKEELATQILKIQNNELMPVVPSNKGAPKKIKIDITPYFVNEEDKAQRTLTFEDHYDKKQQVDPTRPYEIEGVLEQHVSGYGFLRVNNYENSKEDVYVSSQNIKARSCNTLPILKAATM